MTRRELNDIIAALPADVTAIYSVQYSGIWRTALSLINGIRNWIQRQADGTEKISVWYVKKKIPKNNP